jgi:hypothetical protein
MRRNPDCKTLPGERTTPGLVVCTVAEWWPVHNERQLSPASRWYQYFDCGELRMRMQLTIGIFSGLRARMCFAGGHTPGEKRLAVRRRKDAVVLIWIGGEWM